jgi:ABC-type oligopeptide transport system substrate-binding subunit
MRQLIVILSIFSIVLCEPQADTRSASVVRIRVDNYPEIKERLTASITGGLRTNDADQTSHNLDPLIYGGRVALFNQFPYQALQFNTAKDGRTYLCGGSLIKYNYVLTVSRVLKLRLD